MNRAERSSRAATAARLFANEVLNPDLRRAARALLGLATYDPAQLPMLYAARRCDGITQTLLDLAAEEKSSRAQVRAVFRHALSLPTTTIDPDADLAQALFPLHVRCPEQDRLFHIEEILATPDTSITGSHITAWAYAEGRQISNCMLVGHANLAICRIVTARLGRLILEHGDLAGANWMLVFGACRLDPPVGQSETADPLADLVADLKPIHASSGLLKLREISRSHTSIETMLRERIEVALMAGRPALIDLWAPEEPGSAAMLPLYRAGSDGRCQELRLELSGEDFGSEWCERLLLRHRDVMQQYILEDALRRLITYHEWYDRDSAALEAGAVKIAQHVLAGSGAAEQERLAAAYVTLLRDAVYMRQHEQAIYRWLQQREWVQQHSPDRIHLPVEQLKPEDIALLIESARGWLPPEEQDALALEEIALLHAAIIAHDLIPDFEPPARAPDTLQELLLRSLPVRGQRNYPHAKLDSGDGEGTATSMLLSTVALPAILREDQRWIDDTEKLVNLGNLAKQKLDVMNSGLFLDAFLRGAPPHLFREEQDREDYQSWCKTWRDNAWQALHRQLTRQGLRIEPLLGENVVFVVRRKNHDTFTIEPRCIVDQRSLLLLHPHLGMTWYLDPWLYRKPSFEIAENTPQAKRERCLAACLAADEAIAAGEQDAAIEHLRTALRINPARTLQHLLTRTWNTLSADQPHCLRPRNWIVAQRDNPQALRVRSDLAEAVARYMTDQQLPPSAILETFVEHYPDFLPDPYLLLAFRNHRLVAPLAQANADLAVLAITQPQLMDIDRSSSAGEAPTQRLADSAIWQTWHDFIEQSTKIIWGTLCEHEPIDPQIEQARDLDWDAVERVAADGRYQPSARYNQLIAPLVELRRAGEYRRLAATLQELFKLADPAADLPEEAPAQIARHAQNPWLKPDAIRNLLHLHALSDKLSDEQHIERQHWRKHTDELVNHLSSQSLNFYQRATTVLNLARASKWLTLLQHQGSAYRGALYDMLPPQELPIERACLAARCANPDPMPGIVQRVSLDASTRTVTIEMRRGKTVTLLFAGMTDDEAQHFAQVIESRQGPLIDALKGKTGRPSTSPLRPAYALLAHPFPVPKHVACLRAVLLALEETLIKTMAFHHAIPPLRKLLAPADRARVHQMLAIYEDANVKPMLRVEQSPQLVYEYLQTYYPHFLPPSAGQPPTTVQLEQNTQLLGQLLSNDSAS